MTAAGIFLALLADDDGSEYPELLLVVAVIAVAVLIGLSPLLNTPLGGWLGRMWTCLVAGCAG